MAHLSHLFSLPKALPLLSVTALLLVFTACGGHNRKQKSLEGEYSEETHTQQDSPRHASYQLDFKLYMERSGSMVAFDSENSKGEFKGIVSTLLNRFPKLSSNDSTSVYIVNDNVYPYQGSVKDFLAQRNFFNSTKDIGNPSYTDFDKIFEMILADTKKYQVSALITDLIYSTNGQESSSASKLLNEAYALTHNAFKGHTATSLIVLQFEADYNGAYYPYNSPNSGVSYSGNRPFYVMLFASKDSMYELYNSSEYKPFTNFSTLPGYENLFTFTHLTFTPAYSVVTDYNHKGTFGKNRDKASGKIVTAITNAQLSKTEDCIEIPIALDLSALPFSSGYKNDADNYEVSSGTGYEIKSIRPIDQCDNSGSIVKTLPTATHLLILEATERPRNEEVTIKMAYRLPAWIGKSSTSDDSKLNAENFESTTFGFQEVMKGIFAAYVPDGTRHYLFDIKINVEKK